MVSSHRENAIIGFVFSKSKSCCNVGKMLRREGWKELRPAPKLLIHPGEKQMVRTEAEAGSQRGGD